VHNVISVPVLRFVNNESLQLQLRRIYEFILLTCELIFPSRCVHKTEILLSMEKTGYVIKEDLSVCTSAKKVHFYNLPLQSFITVFFEAYSGLFE